MGKTPTKYFQILIAGDVILSLKLKLLQGPGRYINGEEAVPGSSGPGMCVELKGESLPRFLARTFFQHWTEQTK